MPFAGVSSGAAARGIQRRLSIRKIGHRLLALGFSWSPAATKPKPSSFTTKPERPCAIYTCNTKRRGRHSFRFIHGRFVFAVISSALNILNVAAYWQYVVTGIFLISALGVQALRNCILVE